MKKHLFTLLWGLGVWLCATLFFIFLGKFVLYTPGTSSFTISIILLLAGTAVLLWGITHIYVLFDKTNHAALRFGIIGSILGLFLDTFSLSFHRTIFPLLEESQIIAFSAWMSCAYALFLVIPALLNQRIQRQKRMAI
ncbi:hypothetical protein E0485_03180 [Paenibacillus albiflavus]|uniref:DUF5367 domain-containing protein n=1 Tax=Paenibacillus albiflavus TaxID=2545760 RepID=A0A4R4EJJ4_9BACL|nr:DUF5367 family protein [Paenibacillus albiflavus]TCZ79887.1 hypothetical protein E0485_03180 [Paenibacillus albiflavus]